MFVIDKNNHELLTVWYYFGNMDSSIFLVLQLKIISKKKKIYIIKIHIYDGRKICQDIRRINEERTIPI